MGRRDYMRTTINIDDELIREVEALYKAESRSKSIELALKDAIEMKKREKLKELVGKIEFDEEVIQRFRDGDR